MTEMEPSEQSDTSKKTTSEWRWLAWIPVFVLVSAIAVLWVADLRISVSIPFLNQFFVFGSVFIGIAFIVVQAARSFLANGQLSVLMLGCGILTMDIGAVATLIGFSRSADHAFAVYNTAFLLGALCQFLGVIVTTRLKIRLKRLPAVLMVTYSCAIVVMGLVIWSACMGWMPVFYIDGQGGTLLRSLVLTATVTLLVLSAGLLWQTGRSRASAFFFWYALGLGLLAAGLAGSMLISVWNSPLQWVTRSTQVVATVYMCVAVLVSLHEKGANAIPLAAVEKTWLERRSTILRQPSLIGWLFRYVVSLVIVSLAIGIRQILTAWVGPGLPTYLTFYPAVMAIALLAGLGPGIAATVLTAIFVGYWILPPVGEFAIASSVDRLGLLIFTGMGMSISVVVEQYRRNRDKAAAYEREAMERESREALRRQVELFDPVRAEVIAQEMQRVVRERGNKETVAIASTGDILGYVPTVAGALVAAVGILVLAGWIFGLPSLKSVLPGFASMKFNTAFCFVLAGVALALRERRPIRMICAAVVSLIAVLTLAEYVIGVNFGLDEFLLRDIRDIHTIHPGRMVEATAMGFLFVSVSLLLLKSRGKSALRTQQALALGALAIGIIAVLGYIYHVNTFYQLAGHASMAPHTAVSLVLLAGGILFARSEGLGAILMGPGPGAQLTRRLLPGAIFLPAIIGWLRVHGSQAGLFDPNFGTGLFAISMMFTFTALVWWTAHAANRVDAKRRDTEMQLRNQTELMNHAFEPLIVREPGGIIRAWNRGAEDLYGWSAADAIGMPKQLLLNTEGFSIAEQDCQLEQTGRWEGELCHTSHDGKRIIVESRQTATHAGDGRLLILESDSDITLRKQSEEALHHQSAKLMAANKELESFSYSVSHDLRAPLRAIDGFSRMLLRKMTDKLNDEEKRQFEVIRDNTKKMGELIDRLLEFSRLDRQLMSVADIDMSNLVKEVWDELLAINPHRRISLKIHFLPAVSGDAALIRQVLVNLLSNAVKFTKMKEETVIEIGSNRKDSETVYFIRDNGVGFDMQYYEKLFGVFQRLHSNEEFEGTGAGLAIVQRIIKRHGGSVWAEGEVDKGATFYFSLLSAPQN